MPVIRWTQIPPAIQRHLIDRAHERGISIAGLYRLKQWIDQQPEVPDGDWYKDFGAFKLAGRGAYSKTFFTKGQAAKGHQVE